MSKNSLFTSAMIACSVVVSFALAAQQAASAAENYFIYISSGFPPENIHCYHFDPGAETFSLASKSDGGSSPSYLAWSPNRSYLFAINSKATDITGGVVKSFKIFSGDGKLEEKSTVSSGGEGPTHLCVHPSGKFVFVAHYGSGHVASIPVNSNGTLGTATTVLPAEPAGYTPSVPGVLGPKAHMVMTNKAGTRLYVPCLDYDYVAIYTINQIDGTLSFDKLATVPYFNSWRPGPRHMAFSTDEKYAYVINELNSTMTRYVHNPATGGMTAPLTYSTLPSGVVPFEGTPPKRVYTAAHVMVSPDNKRLYGSNRDVNITTPDTENSSMVTYSISQSTGELTLWGHNKDTANRKLAHPRDFTVDPTGKTLLVASRDVNLVKIFSIDTNGDLISTSRELFYAKAPVFVGVMPKASVLTTLQITPLTPTLVVDAKQTFTVNGFDQFGLAMATTAPQWRIVTGPGAINPTTGEFMAPSSAGDTTIEVSDGGKTEITIIKTTQKASVLTTLQITPLTPTLVVNAKQTFTVNGFDQFGLAMATTAPQWRIVTGPGVINPTTGEFTAPSSAGDTTIEVSDGGNTASTTVKTQIAGGGSSSGDGGGGGGGGCGLGSGAASWLILLGGLMLVLRTSRHRDIMR